MPAVTAQRMKSLTLDNGLEVSYTSTPDEARYIYEENYEERQYLQNGISLKPGGTVIDVGANTGMFAILAAQEVGAKGRVIAFEPAPDVHACCVANVAAHRAWALRRQEQAGAQAAAAPAEVEVLQKGCGDGTVDSLTLVSYDNLSAVNTVVPDHEDAVHILKSFLEAQISEGKPVGNKLQRAVIAGGWRLYHNALTGPVVRFAIERYARMMLAARREVVCEMTTVSDVMRERGIDRVSLLKVDVERAELIVLEGVKDADWPKIDQVAVEVHDQDGRQAKVLRLLRDQGFKNITVSADKVLGDSLSMIHATR